MIHHSESREGQTPSILLKEKLIRYITQHGPMTFSDFMQESLYGEYGFFSSGEVITGTTVYEGENRGFLSKTTIPERTPLMARLIAIQLPYIWEQMGKPQRFDFVEMGAGTGSFAREVLDIAKNFPDFFEHLHYTIVDVSPSLVELQRKNVKSEKANWVIASAVDFSLNNIEGIVFSNELVDNFPFHRMKMANGKLQEIFVGVKDGELVNVFDTPSSLILENYFAGENVEMGEGQEAWVNRNALQWIRNVAGGMKRGYVLTIDYGNTAEMLYHPLSVLSQVYNYQMNGRLVSAPGTQDITAGVDFTALMNEGEEVGLKVEDFLDQSDYFVKLGLPELIDQESRNLPLNPQERRNKLWLLQQAQGLLKIREYKILIQKKE